MTRLDLQSPIEYFKERIGEACSNLSHPLEDDLEFYLVNLLCEYIHPSKIKDIDTPLALQLKDALETEMEERRLRIYKMLGDTSLYLAGYFQGYFNRKVFDINYYISMGANAYLEASEVESTAHLASIYAELSQRFGNLVEIIATVADSCAMSDHKNLLALYDRWTRTGSERLRKKLEDEGITPIRINMNKAQ